MRVTLLQTDIVWEDKQENLRLLREKLIKLRGVAEIVVLPETFSTGFSMDSRRLAEPVSGVTIATLRQWAAEFQFAIAGSYIACDEEADANKNAVPIPDKSYYNRAFFLTPEGEAYYYDKRHLFRMGQETEHFTAGSQRPVISYRGWNILLLVCYDLRFPELYRQLVTEGGAQVLVVPAAFMMHTGRDHWEVLLRARAIENQCYVVASGQTGDHEPGRTCFGRSMVVDPWGTVLGQVPDGVGLTVVELDLDRLDRIRTELPSLANRRL